MEDTALINNLNDDCLKHIFSFLPVEERLEVEKVCRRWHNIGEQGWDDVKELIIDDDDTDNLIYLMFKRCGRYLRKLIVWYASAHPHCLSMAIEFCRLHQLKEIEIVNLYYKARDAQDIVHNLGIIFEKCENLVVVSLQGNLRTEMLNYLNFLNPTTLRRLELVNRSKRLLSINPDRFPNLKELYLEGIGIIENEMIREEESLKRLELLNLDRCYDSENLLQRIWTFTNLRELGLFGDIFDMQNEDVRLIATHCHNIEKMTLRNTNDLTSDCFQYLGDMRSLEALNLIRFNVNPRHLAYLMNVKKLGFYRCWDILEDNELLALIANSSNLEELKIHKVRAVDRDFLYHVDQIFQLGQRDKHLQLIIEGAGYKCLNGLIEVTDHPLLDLTVENDLAKSEESDEDDDDNDDDGDDDNDAIEDLNATGRMGQKLVPDLKNIICCTWSYVHMFFNFFFWFLHYLRILK